MELSSLRPVAPLPLELKEKHSAGAGDIQRIDAIGHRDGHLTITGIDQLPGNSVSLAP